ncbi:MAG: hypothetical protein HDR27_00625, partial [Lachnospiraceae bacterium]|nr:hypothetical protein [Lachnospiraceae bacterium]
MKRKWIKNMGVLLAASLILSGCGASDGEPSTPDGEQDSQVSESVIQTEEEESVPLEEAVPDPDMQSLEPAYTEREYKEVENPLLKADGKVLRDNAGEGDIVQLRGT